MCTPPFWQSGKTLGEWTDITARGMGTPGILLKYSHVIVTEHNKVTVYNNYYTAKSLINQGLETERRDA